jgi:hypothetical protein
MGRLGAEIVQLAIGEWEFFNGSTRGLSNDAAAGWNIASNELEDPYRERINRYWTVVGEPDWDGATPEPWSGAFICWCFSAAIAAGAFTPSRKHARYIDRILRRDGMSPRLRLRPPSRGLEAGDLIWNARGDDQPAGHDEAVERLRAGSYFDSHVDVVVAVRDGECDSIGGNVYPPGEEGGTVVRSTWRLDDGCALADGRKNWIGVVKNGL